jgi:hypothetical protein
MKWLRALLLGPLLLLALPATARADDSIFTLKYVDGENIIIASYNVHDFTADVPITFNLRVYTIAGVPVVYKSVEAIVEQHDKIIFDQTMAASTYNDVNWVYAFTEAGDFDLTLHFTNHGTPLAQARFPIVVANGPIHGEAPSAHSHTSQIFAWPAGTTFLLGIGLTLLVQRHFKRPAGGQIQTRAARSEAAAEPRAMTEVS